MSSISALHPTAGKTRRKLPRYVAVAVAGATLLLAVLGTPIAAAHSQPTGFTPDGDIAQAPARASVRFNESLQEESAFLQVVGPDGNIWSRGGASVDGDSVSVALGNLGPAGQYTLAYRVTSADGHVVKGSHKFTLTVPGRGTPGPPAAAESDGDSIPLWPFIVGGVAVLAAGLFFALRKPRKP